MNRVLATSVLVLLVAVACLPGLLRASDVLWETEEFPIIIFAPGAEPMPEEGAETYFRIIGRVTVNAVHNSDRQYYPALAISRAGIRQFSNTGASMVLCNSPLRFLFSDSGASTNRVFSCSNAQRWAGCPSENYEAFVDSALYFHPQARTQHSRSSRIIINCDCI